MSVNNTTNKAIFNGDGVTKSFPFSSGGSNILVYAQTDIIVESVAADGTVSLRVLTTDYSVSLTSYGLSGQYTATITMVTAPVLGTQLILIRTLPLTQTVTEVDNELTQSSVRNQVYDRLVMLCQQLQEQVSRAVLASVSSLGLSFPASNPGKVLGWDSSGNLTNVTANTGAYLGKASQATAEAATDDTNYMTALQVKNEIQKAGALKVPVANMASGTPDGTKFIRDDGTLQAVSVLTKATGSDINNGADDAKYTTSYAIANSGLMNFNASRIKLGTFTRAMDAATGDVSYTGIGFTPKMVIFFGGVSGSVRITHNGFSDGTNHYCTYNNSGVVSGQSDVDNASCIRLQEATGKQQTAIVKTMDADGFTLTWTRTGATASGTAYLFFTVYR